jgi:hypothetical protein
MRTDLTCKNIYATQTCQIITSAVGRWSSPERRYRSQNAGRSLCCGQPVARAALPTGNGGDDESSNYKITMNFHNRGQPAARVEAVWAANRWRGAADTKPRKPG